MGIPTIDTKGWRLPKRGKHDSPEVTYTDEMYLKKGLPVTPTPTPSTGGSGLPVVDTREWTLPKKEAPLEETKYGPGGPTYTERELVGYLRKHKRVSVGELAYSFGGHPQAHTKFLQALVKKGKLTFVHRKGGGFYTLPTQAVEHSPLDEVQESPSEVAMALLGAKWNALKRDGWRAVPFKLPSGKRLSDLDMLGPLPLAKVRAFQDRGVMLVREGSEAARSEDELDEFNPLDNLKPKGTASERFVQSRSPNYGEGCDGSFKRRKAGKPVKGRKGKGRGMSVGQGEGPVGRRAVEDVQSVQRRLAGLVESQHIEFAVGTPYRRMPDETMLVEVESEQVEAAGELIGKHQASTGMKIGSLPWVVVKATPTRVTVASGSGVNPGSKFSGKKYVFTWDGTGYKRQGQYLHTDGVYALKESFLSSEQKALAGLTERAPLPRPLHDTRPVASTRTHGILDDGEDAGDAYVDRVLRESRWFFRDFGDLALGDRPFGEAPGGRSGPWRGSDDKPAKTPVVRQGKVKGVVGGGAQKKAKAKAPPEDVPVEERDSGVSHGLRSLGQHLKSTGHRMGHGSLAQKAKERLHGHIRKFAKKHGIGTHAAPAKKKGEPPKVPGKKAKPGGPKQAAPLVGPKMKRPGEDASKPKAKPRSRPKAKPKAKAAE